MLFQSVTFSESVHLDGRPEQHEAAAAANSSLAPRQVMKANRERWAPAWSRSLRPMVSCMHTASLLLNVVVSLLPVDARVLLSGRTPPQGWWMAPVRV